MLARLGGVDEVANEELIASAAAVLKPHTVTRYGEHLLRDGQRHGRQLGHVGCTLVTAAGNRYSGVCIDAGSGIGFCAEHAAIAAMVTAGEYRIAKIVAVWRDADGTLYVLPPCGRCREFIRQIDPANINTQVVTGRDSIRRLRELLPLHEWPPPLQPPTADG
jgi:cytidine deaminase